MTNIPEITEALCKALREDEEFYKAYQANIAMAFYDEWLDCSRKNTYGEDISFDMHIIPHNVILDIANQAAKNFLDMWIGIKSK